VLRIRSEGNYKALYKLPVIRETRARAVAYQ
jgi:hypothetical protein